MGFSLTFISVASLLVYAIPGYILSRMGSIKESSISSFATVLMCVCQPCLCLYSLNNVDYSYSLFKDMITFFIITFFLQLVVVLISYALLRSRCKSNAKYRVGAVAASFGNCGFFGIPLLQSLLPDRPEAVALATMFMIAMNLLGWTIASAIITNDRKYVSFKKAIFNPATFGFTIGFILFLTQTKLPSALNEIVTVCGKMSTPLCMLIVGMRLATVPLSSLVKSPFVFGVVGVKQIVFPLIALLLGMILPVPDYMKTTLFILCATPVASIVLNFAEMRGEGQKEAANMVLMGTVSCIITIPLLLLIL